MQELNNFRHASIIIQLIYSVSNIVITMLKGVYLVAILYKVALPFRMEKLPWKECWLNIFVFGYEWENSEQFRLKYQNQIYSDTDFEEFPVFILLLIYKLSKANFHCSESCASLYEKGKISKSITKRKEGKKLFRIWSWLAAGDSPFRKVVGSSTLKLRKYKTIGKMYN